MICFNYQENEQAVAIVAMTKDDLTDWLGQQDSFTQNWINAAQFKAKAHSFCLLPDHHGHLLRVLVGLDEDEPMWSLAGLPEKLPPGNYYLDTSQSAYDRIALAIGWGLGSYQFTRYKKTPPRLAQLTLRKPEHDFEQKDIAYIENMVTATALVRDMINTPAADMTPAHIAGIADQLASEFKAQCVHTVGEQLQDAGYPLVHAVGRASSHAPRVIELCWGAEHDHALTLVGKGVCFDSGGLDLKSSNAMRLMKKDMGGAAHVLGLARMIMAAGLPIRLRVLIAAVENMVSANAFKPGDVLYSRAGKSIEIDNTDAEGRLILGDLLTCAAEEKPALIVDFATLTGAARVAVGTEIASFFCTDDEIAQSLQAQGQRYMDPLWRLPLHTPYRNMLDSDIADLANSSASGYAGAITAALFLREFTDTVPWVHFDIMAWNTRARPGRAKGGEAMAIRGVFHWLLDKFHARRSSAC